MVFQLFTGCSVDYRKINDVTDDFTLPAELKGYKVLDMYSKSGGRCITVIIPEDKTKPVTTIVSHPKSADSVVIVLGGKRYKVVEAEE
jgi:hypothetical protein